LVFFMDTSVAVSGRGDEMLPVALLERQPQGLPSIPPLDHPREITMFDQVTDKNWPQRGHCRYRDPELFFPVGEGTAFRPQIAEAKGVCRPCPVATQCLAWALSSGQDEGIWGGMTPDERRSLKRREARRRQRESSQSITVADEAVA
jgi:WhiB family redox-sensing transcriptional regulator